MDVVIKQVSADLGSAVPAGFAKETDELKATVVSIIRDHAKLSKYSSDPALMVDVYYDISREMLEMPDLRLTWLENMTTHLETVGYFQEAAMTKVLSAYLVVKYLTLIDKWDKVWLI